VCGSSWCATSPGDPQAFASSWQLARSTLDGDPERAARSYAKMVYEQPLSADHLYNLYRILPETELRPETAAVLRSLLLKQAFLLGPVLPDR
jgi:hypothetical protein